MEKSLKNSKIIGGIGALLPLFVFIPKIGFILGLASPILLLFAMKGLADVSEKKSIFKNYLIYFLLNMGAAIIIFVGILGFILAIGTKVIFIFKKDILLPAILRGGIIFAISFIFAWILFVISAYFLKKSFQEVSKVFKADLFKVTGLIIFIGSILSLFLIGFLIFPLGNLLMAISFFSLPDKFEQKDEVSSTISPR